MMLSRVQAFIVPGDRIFAFPASLTTSVLWFGMYGAVLHRGIVCCVRLRAFACELRAFACVCERLAS